MRVSKLTIESNRTLGGVAAILTVVGVFSLITSLFHSIFPNSLGLTIVSFGVSGVFGVLAFVGFLLFLIAMYGFSKDYNEHRIFSYLLYGIVITIVAVVITSVISVLIILFNFASLFPNLSSSSSTQVPSFSNTFAWFTPVFGLVAVIWTVFVMLSFNLLSDKSKVPLFRTGAKVLLAGPIINIVIAILFAAMSLSAHISLSLNVLLALLTIGNLVQTIAWVLLAKAYFSIQAPAAPAQLSSPSYAAPVFGQVKYCSRCGAPNQLDAQYCTRCGQKL